MSEEGDTRTEEQNTPRSWQPTSRQVLWVIGVGLALETLAMLVVKFYPDIWKDLSRERVATLIGIGVAVTVIVVLLAMGGASLGWTGFRGRTVWDWLPVFGAFLIPVVIAVGTGWITWQQAKIEDQRAQDASLQAYLDQMSGLLLEKDLRSSDEDSEVRTLARARTLTVLGRLDPSRKREVMRFLIEAELVQRVEETAPIISLGGADLSGGVYLRDANLRGAYLRGASLRRADLRSADLSDANLRGAFERTVEGSKQLITNEELEQQASSLEGATMPNDQKYEEWLKSKGSGEDGENESGP